VGDFGRPGGIEPISEEAFRTLVIEDACRAIDLAGSLAAAWRKMTDAGVERIDSARLLA
jgi:nicotinamidase/pyrazinamidase